MYFICIIIIFLNYYYATIIYVMQYKSKWLISPWGLGTNLLYFIFCLYYMFVLFHYNKQIQYVYIKPVMYCISLMSCSLY